MVNLTECPNCGGPIINGGGTDIRCATCGMNYDELIDFLGDEIEVDEDFVGEEREAVELGYPVDGVEEGLDSDW